MRTSLALTKTLLFMITTLVLTGCGFHLRSDTALPDSADYLYVQASSKNAPLVRALQTRMGVYQIKGGTTEDPSR